MIKINISSEKWNEIKKIHWEWYENYLEKKDIPLKDNLPNGKKNVLDLAFRKKKAYFDVMNKAIEYYLIQKAANKLSNSKIAAELDNRKNAVKNKKLEYKKQIENVEKARVEYMDFQGNNLQLNQNLNI